jgi:hypothetical protein
MPKNSADHSTFSANCTPNAIIAILRNGDFDSMTKYNAIPINANRIVHAGANTQFGGFNADFIKLLYHVSMAGVVNMLPMLPISSQRTINPISFGHFICDFCTGFIP